MVQFRFEKDYEIDVRSARGAIRKVKAISAGAVETLTEEQAEAAEEAGVGTREQKAQPDAQAPAAPSRRG